MYGKSENEFKNFAIEIFDKLLLNKWDVSFFLLVMWMKDI